MLKNIAVLITCFNRKEQTLICLTNLFNAAKELKDQVRIKVFLTDDASTDGTSEFVQNSFPDVKILKGNGKLFWTRGMLKSWDEALKYNFDSYLLLNDDTKVFNSVFRELIDMEEYSMNKFGKKGIYIGSTLDESSNKLSYGGAILTNKFLFYYTHLSPNGTYQECTLGNGNIMLVSSDVIKEIGLLSNKYNHGVADYAYTLMATRHNIPVFVAKNYCGSCSPNNKNKFEIFRKLGFIGRIKFLFNPIGFAFKDNLIFMFDFFPFRLPLVLLGAAIKVISPLTYLKLNKRTSNS
jgi:GT2 family glycosyltransferase